MAGRNIKGITVEIGGDTTKLQTALEGVNSKIKNTQAQLRDVEKLLKLDPGNTELLAQKHKLLADAVTETKQKLETLETAAKQANDALAKGDSIVVDGETILVRTIDRDGGVTINVYGREGQDISALADEIEERINLGVARRNAAFA